MYENLLLIGGVVILYILGTQPEKDKTPSRSDVSLRSSPLSAKPVKKKKEKKPCIPTTDNTSISGSAPLRSDTSLREEKED